jgi:cobalt-zinc-cadmium efflux system membrane fusion protein
MLNTMHPGPITILVVDDDEVLRRVIGRILSRDGHCILEASDADSADERACQQQPQLALIDLRLPGSDGVEVARRLAARYPGLSMILMSADLKRLQDEPDIGTLFARVLTKPIDLADLRLAVASALKENLVSESHPQNFPDHDLKHESTPVHPEGHAEQSAAPALPSGGKKATAVVIVGLVVLAGFVLFLTGLIPSWHSANAGENKVEAPPPLQVDLVPDKPNTAQVPEDVRQALGIRSKTGKDNLTAAREPEQMAPLVLSGSTDLDPAHVHRVRLRFTPADVMQITKIKARSDDPARFESVEEERELHPGDEVKRGDVLAVVHSVDVGSKKNDLFDALVMLDMDKKILVEAMKTSGVLPLGYMLSARRNYVSDLNAVSRAENTLSSWGIPDKDIKTIRDEATEASAKAGDKIEESLESEQARKDRIARWARVELKAPDNGIIVEQNVTQRETIIDNTLILFQIAQVDRLLVKANAPEDDTARLQELLRRREPLIWTVHTAGAPPRGITGRVDDISYLLDVNQHNSVVKGYIPNEGRLLRAGQYVRALVTLKPPPDVVEIPVSAVADDGKQSVVFVQTDPKKPGEYEMRRVEITKRYDRTVFVRSKFEDGKDEQALSPEDKDAGLLPRHTLKAGEQLITAGVLELKKELEDRMSRSK